MIDIVVKLATWATYATHGQRIVIQEARDNIHRLRSIIELLLAYEDHDEDVYRGAAMWEELIEKARNEVKQWRRT